MLLQTTYNWDGSMRRCEVTVVEPYEDLDVAEECLRVAREVDPDTSWDIVPDTTPQVPRRFLEASAGAASRVEEEA